MQDWSLPPVGNLKRIGSTVKFLPISEAGNFIYSSTHIRAILGPKCIFGVTTYNLGIMVTCR
ncbi:hypothetical protein E2C01_058610 [Portunus trituberculatus]|uniref:Uncharacterized protein n=1 Tax=Portunus trituberculatus TaxID=210409 RepID=A0A5B7H362_PORTR|nr:hypothetical protein [Portunus trituberculatus]